METWILAASPVEVYTFACCSRRALRLVLVALHKPGILQVLWSRAWPRGIELRQGRSADWSRAIAFVNWASDGDRASRRAVGDWVETLQFDMAPCPRLAETCPWWNLKLRWTIRRQAVVFASLAFTATVDARGLPWGISHGHRIPVDAPLLCPRRVKCYPQMFPWGNALMPLPLRAVRNLAQSLRPALMAETRSDGAMHFKVLTDMPSGPKSEAINLRLVPNEAMRAILWLRWRMSLL